MEINLKIAAEFDAVYLVNGELSESSEFSYGQDDVVYITILPLDAALLPYTLKMVGGGVKNNSALAKSYRLNAGEYHLKLLPRYNYIYSVENTAASNSYAANFAPASKPQRFFDLVIKKKLAAARELLSDDLNQSIDDASLGAFFAGFFDMVPGSATGDYYLINRDNCGVLYNFALVGGLIDNIIEK